LKDLPAFADTDLIAPACHDTASAIAAVTQNLGHTAYIVSGTWSLVGTVVDSPVTTKEAYNSGFTNQGEAAGGYCFHTNINGMWLLKQCIDHWLEAGRSIDLVTLVAEAESVKPYPERLDVDAAPLLLAGRMPERINYQLEAQRYARNDYSQQSIPDEPGNEPIFARLIFESLAARYAEVIKNLESLTGRSFQRITILGGGSRNALLSRLTEEATGLPTFPGEAEGSTLGNFAVQLASLESPGGLTPESLRNWASFLTTPVSVSTG